MMVEPAEGSSGPSLPTRLTVRLGAGIVAATVVGMLGRRTTMGRQRVGCRINRSGRIGSGKEHHAGGIMTPRRAFACHPIPTIYGYRCGYDLRILANNII